MASLHPGPFCQEVGILSSDLQSNNLSEISPNSLKNGLILELKLFADKLHLSLPTVIQWIKTLQPESSASLSTLKYRITNACEVNKKLNSKKKVKGFKSAKEFKSSLFNVAESEIRASEGKTPSARTEPTLAEPVNVDVLKIHTNEDKNERHVVNLAFSDTPQPVTENDSMKDFNLLKYEVKKKQKVLKKMEVLISAERETLKKLKERKGHYSVRNIEKRDARAAKNRQLLREAKRTIFKQEEVIQRNKKKLRKLKKINLKLKNDLMNRSFENEHARRSMLNSEDHVQQLMLANEKLQNTLDKESSSNVRKKQSANYFKRSLNKLRNSVMRNESIRKLKETIAEKERKIELLCTDVESLQENLKDHFETKNSDGSFNNSVRLCVIELASLEVAVEKISKVIQSVSKQIFSRELTNSDLPTKSTIQTIIDEGHYLAKKFIATKIESAETFGINRDGTTRKKQKVLDTSVTLDTGEILSLGFTRVAHETAVTINEVTKNHVQEMSQMQSNENYIRNTLEKLSFSMSDRASNEKAADRLLDEWRDEVLGSSPETDIQKIKHFHCMAHVLLGFHKYSCDDLKKFEEKVTEQFGPIGRDSLPQFKSWRKTGTVVERVVRTVSETFGPAGDHLGLRDRWEAQCSEHGVKSVIGNYKDNRFNGLFQTSAEVLLHARDMLHVLNTVQQPNRKLIAVKADLQSLVVQTFLQCFGLMYVKITGPYWNLVTSGTVPYLMLYSHIQTLSNYLKECSISPEILLSPDGHWESEDTLGVSDIQSRKLFESHLFVEPHSDYKDMLLECIKVVSSAMLRCIEKQLSDFLPGGHFSQSPSTKDLSRTGYAHATNLGCEHHFGDLDSSQKRRPNASMHHHSSIQLLKRNRNQMLEWITEMPQKERDDILKGARKGGRSLRESHLKAEKDVLSKIHNDMLQETVKKGKKRKSQIDENLEFEEEITSDNCVLNEYVAVAYQDMWYPGIIEKISENFLTVNFLATTRTPGFYTWPVRKDVQRVSPEFVIKRGFVPECKNSGRLWYIEDHEDISHNFEKYRKIYF